MPIVIATSLVHGKPVQHILDGRLLTLTNGHKYFILEELGKKTVLHFKDPKLMNRCRIQLPN